MHVITLATFQRCETTIFSDFLDDSLEVFIEIFSIFEDGFDSCLVHLTKILEIWVKLGEISLHGTKGSRARASRLRQMIGGG